MEKRNEEEICRVCEFLSGGIEGDERKLYDHYDAVIKTAARLVEYGALELFAGDCPLEAVDNVLKTERHYTVCHYLQCKSCGAVYFVGACIRGTPIYRKVDRLDWDKIRRQLWGRCGSVDLSGGNKL